MTYMYVCMYVGTSSLTKGIELRQLRSDIAEGFCLVVVPWIQRHILCTKVYISMWLRRYVYMYVCMYICMCVCVCIYRYRHRYRYTCMYVCICVYIHRYSFLYLCLFYIHIHIHIIHFQSSFSTLWVSAGNAGANPTPNMQHAHTQTHRNKFSVIDVSRGKVTGQLLDVRISICECGGT